MSILFEVGVVHYTHSVVVIVSLSPTFIEYIEFVIGMHEQGHWGDLSEFEASISDVGLVAGTSVTSHYELVEEFELLGDAIIMVTDLQLTMTMTIVSLADDY